jgi:HK97 family phage prohead protease
VNPLSREEGLRHARRFLPAGFETRSGALGGRSERRAASFANVEVRASGKNDGSYTVNGEAVVYSRYSLDLGGFKEVIEPGALTGVLRAKQDVVALHEHNPERLLGRVSAGTLDLHDTPQGLRTWIRVAPTTYGLDLKVLLDRRDISQMSFAFIVGDDTWRENPDGSIVRVVQRIDQLFDVSLVSSPAYPQTSAEVQRALTLADRARALRAQADGTAARKLRRRAARARALV